MTNQNGNFDIWRMGALLAAGLGAGVALINFFEGASADKQFNALGLSALVSGVAVIWLVSLIIPAGYEPGKTTLQAHLIRFTAAFLPVLIFVIIFSLVKADWRIAPFISPFIGIAGYFAGCKIAERSLTS